MVFSLRFEIPRPTLLTDKSLSGVLNFFEYEATGFSTIDFLAYETGISGHLDGCYYSFFTSVSQRT